MPRPASTHAFEPEVAATATTPWSSGLLMYAPGGVALRHARPSQRRTTTVPLPGLLSPQVVESAHSSPASHASGALPAHSPPTVTPASPCEIRQPARPAGFGDLATGAGAAADTDPTNTAKTASAASRRANRGTTNQPADPPVRTPYRTPYWVCASKPSRLRITHRRRQRPRPHRAPSAGRCPRTSASTSAPRAPPMNAARETSPARLRPERPAATGD